MNFGQNLLRGHLCKERSGCGRMKTKRRIKHCIRGSFRANLCWSIAPKVLQKLSSANWRISRKQHWGSTAFLLYIFLPCLLFLAMSSVASLCVARATVWPSNLLSLPSVASIGGGAAFRIAYFVCSDMLDFFGSLLPLCLLFNSLLSRTSRFAERRAQVPFVALMFILKLYFDLLKSRKTKITANQLESEVLFAGLQTWQNQRVFYTLASLRAQDIFGHTPFMMSLLPTIHAEVFNFSQQLTIQFLLFSTATLSLYLLQNHLAIFNIS